MMSQAQITPCNCNNLPVGLTVTVLLYILFYRYCYCDDSSVRMRNVSVAIHLMQARFPGEDSGFKEVRSEGLEWMCECCKPCA